MSEQQSTEATGETPARFRKTKTGKWAVMAPVPALEKALAEGGKIDVQRKSGDWSSFVVVSLGRPFDVDGIQMCYGYGPDEEDPDSASDTGDKGRAGGRQTTSPRSTAPSRTRAAAPPSDPSEPLPEYQGSAEDEWGEF